MIRFCFEFVSPSAYVAWLRIHGIAAKHGEAVEAVPVLFAWLLKANRTRGSKRMLRAVQMVDDGARRRRLVDELFEAVWGEGAPGVTEPAVVPPIAERAGLDGAALIDGAGTDVAKERLRDATDAALADDAFGVPTMW